LAKKPTSPAAAEVTSPAQPESVKVQVFVGGVFYCPECRHAMVNTCSSIGKLTVQHEKSECIYSGRHFEPPTVELQPIK